MLPKWHILIGAIFTFLIWQFINAGYGNVIVEKSLLFPLLIIFLSSFLIDVDHYVFYVFKKRDISLKNAYNWFLGHRIGHSKPFMFAFHSIEFLSVLTILSFYFNVFFLVLIGFVLHVVTDLINTFINGKIDFKGFSFLLYILGGKNGK